MREGLEATCALDFGITAGGMEERFRPAFVKMFKFLVS